MIDWLSAEQLGQQLRQLRIQKGVTQEDLATRVGWAAGSGWRISEYESGKKRPHPSTLQKLLEGLEVPRQALVSDLPQLNKTRVGQLIRLFRCQKGWTQKELAEKLLQHLDASFSARLIGAWERETRCPRLPHLEVIANWMGEDLSVFEGPTLDWLESDELASRIHRLRLQQGMTQAELAQSMGRPGTQQHISRWERGLATPNAQSLLALSQALEVPLEVFQEPQMELALEG